MTKEKKGISVWARRLWEYERWSASGSNWPAGQIHDPQKTTTNEARRESDEMWQRENNKINRHLWSGCLLLFKYGIMTLWASSSTDVKYCLHITIRPHAVFDFIGSFVIFEDIKRRLNSPLLHFFYSLLVFFFYSLIVFKDCKYNFMLLHIQQCLAKILNFFHIMSYYVLKHQVYLIGNWYGTSPQRSL